MVLWLLAMAGALWTLLPTYVANACAPLSFGVGPKMDLGRKWKDGRLILGTSKTWSGFFIGGLMGLIVGLIEEYLILLAPPSLQLVPFFSSSMEGAVIPLIMLSFGAMAGDAVGSFAKRRIGVTSGGRAPLLDQLPFILVPMLLVGAAYPALFTAAFWPAFPLGAFIVAWVLILSLFLHTSFNWVGYFAGLKRVPW